MALVVKNLAVSAGDTGDAGSIPGLGGCPGVGNDNPPQYSCLENSMDRGAWQAIGQGAAKIWTPLSNGASTIFKSSLKYIDTLSSKVSFSGALMSLDLCELHLPLFLYPHKTAQRHWNGGSFSNESDTDFRMFFVYFFSPPNKSIGCILLQFLHNRWGTEFLKSKTKGQDYERES